MIHRQSSTETVESGPRNAEDDQATSEATCERAQNPPCRTQRSGTFENDFRSCAMTLVDKSMTDFTRIDQSRLVHSGDIERSIIDDDELVRGRRCSEQSGQKYLIPEAVPVTLEYLKSFQRLESKVGIVSIRNVFVGVFVFFTLLLGIGLISISSNYSMESSVIQSSSVTEIQAALLSFFNFSNREVISIARTAVSELVVVILEQAALRAQTALANMADVTDASATELADKWLRAGTPAQPADLDTVLAAMWSNLILFPAVSRLRYADHSITALTSYLALTRLSNGTGFLVDVRPSAAAACSFCPPRALAETTYTFMASSPGPLAAMTLVGSGPYDPLDAAWYSLAGPGGRTGLIRSETPGSAVAALAVTTARMAVNASGVVQGVVAAEVPAVQASSFLAVIKRQLIARLAAAQRTSAAAGQIDLTVVDQNGVVVATSAASAAAAVGQTWAAAAAAGLLSEAAHAGLRTVSDHWAGNWSRLLADTAAGGDYGYLDGGGGGGGLTTYANADVLVGSLGLVDGRGLRLVVVAAAGNAMYSAPVDAALRDAAEQLSNRSAAADLRIDALKIKVRSRSPCSHSIGNSSFTHRQETSVISSFSNSLAPSHYLRLVPLLFSSSR